MESAHFFCVLLVDDDDTSIFLSDLLLVRSRIADHTHSALNGEDALLYLRSQLTRQAAPDAHKPNLILLDINMPIMDGFEFLEAWSQLDFSGKDQVKIVMLTSSSNPRDLDAARHYGVHGFLNKPLTREKIMDLKIS
ncbi:MAG: response regulator [Bacteroidia bacterium]|nr:response regulator [Bacteroidia bacterium]